MLAGLSKQRHNVLLGLTTSWKQEAPIFVRPFDEGAGNSHPMCRCIIDRGDDTGS